MADAEHDPDFDLEETAAQADQQPADDNDQAAN